MKRIGTMLVYLSIMSVVSSSNLQCDASKQQTRIEIDPQIINGPIFIADPGLFALDNDLILDEGVGIEIASNEVHIDLGGRTIYCTGDVTSAILVDSGFNNIMIKNGTIRDAISGAAITIDGSQCFLKNITFVNNQVGVELVDAVDTIIKNCIVVNSSVYGFNLDGCVRTRLQNCHTLNTGGSCSCNIFGFIAADGSDNIFIDCSARGTQTNDVLNSVKVAGFALQGSEASSQIISCIVDQVTTPASSGLESPYGILVERYTGAGLSELTNAALDLSATINTVAWSPVSRILAVGTDANGGDTELQIYALSAINSLVKITDVELGAAVNSVSWSPDGTLLAVGSDLTVQQLKLYAFDGHTLTLLDTHSFGAASVTSVSWSTDGHYLAVGATTAAANEVVVYACNGTTLTSLATATSVVDVLSVSWSADGNFIAVGKDNNESGAELFIYPFNGSALGTAVTAEVGAAVRSVSWTPSGAFVAVGGDASSSVDIRVYSFDGISLSQEVSASHGAPVNSVAWLNDGRYLAIGGQTDGTDVVEIRIYEFGYNGTNFTLTEKVTGAHGAEIFAVNWSIDGNLFTVGGVENNAGLEGHVAQLVLTGATQCTVENNSVSNVHGGKGTGVGISASSEDNYIVNNRVFDADISYSLVVNPYVGGLFGSPKVLQNIGIPPR